MDITDEEQKHIDEDPNWMSAADLLKENKKRLAEGKPNLKLRFGSFNKDKDYLELMHKLAHRDYQDMRAHVAEMFDIVLAGGEGAKQLETVAQQRLSDDQREFSEGKFDDEAKELGMWMATYFYSAGHGWNNFPNMYKVMIMNAFPPMPRIDKGVPLTKAMPAWLGWLDKDIKALNDDPFHTSAMLGKYHAIKLH